MDQLLNVSRKPKVDSVIIYHILCIFEIILELVEWNCMIILDNDY